MRRPLAAGAGAGAGCVRSQAASASATSRNAARRHIPRSLRISARKCARSLRLERRSAREQDRPIEGRRPPMTTLLILALLLLALGLAYHRLAFWAWVLPLEL